MRELEAGTRKEGTGGRELEAGNWRQGTGSVRAGNWDQGIGGRELEAGNWRQGLGYREIQVTFGTNKKLSIKTAAARDWALPLAPGCYPDPNSGVLS